MKTTLSMITVRITIKASVAKTWKCWITPADIMQWNIPFDEWHTPRVDNDVKDGGHFLYRMEKKDGSAGFDFEGKYDKVVTNELMEYTLSDGRKSIITFMADGGETILIEAFEPETNDPVEMQKDFCQNVLVTFKNYTENKNGDQ